jgi:hypothetical protein
VLEDAAIQAPERTICTHLLEDAAIQASERTICTLLLEDAARRGAAGRVRQA